MTALAITLGSVFSLLAYDLLGLAAAGIVVPGYLALELDQPGRVAGLFFVALATYGVNSLLGRFMLLYGRRQLVMSVLVGCVLAQSLRAALAGLPEGVVLFQSSRGAVGLEAMGWVIPGLMAYWCTRQGVVRTFGALLLTAAMVRLTLIAIAGFV